MKLFNNTEFCSIIEKAEFDYENESEFNITKFDSITLNVAFNSVNEFTKFNFKRNVKYESKFETEKPLSLTNNKMIAFSRSSSLISICFEIRL